VQAVGYHEWFMYRIALFATISLLSATLAWAQALDVEAIRASKRATALRISEPIAIDGVMDEEAWEGADPAVDFYQQFPEEFELATRRTEVRFLYDDDALYIGAMLYDEAPDELITNDLKRDFSAFQSDAFAIVLDTFLDRRNSYVFFANPGGAQRDVLSVDNGRRNDVNWDGVWFSRSVLRSDGWSAEFAIPFKTLRFPERETQEWGLNLLRPRRLPRTRAWTRALSSGRCCWSRLANTLTRTSSSNTSRIKAR
jgi:hypothetical protein